MAINHSVLGWPEFEKFTVRVRGNHAIRGVTHRTPSVKPVDKLGEPELRFNGLLVVLGRFVLDVVNAAGQHGHVIGHLLLVRLKIQRLCIRFLPQHLMECRQIDFVHFHVLHVGKKCAHVAIKRFVSVFLQELCEPPHVHLRLQLSLNIEQLLREISLELAPCLAGTCLNLILHNGTQCGEIRGAQHRKNSRLRQNSANR
mmetsp:Transcript_39137/g.120957  ORF Transcript_39137/g.120957 Transcript_39137/m.120957 type:complete len:200 (+) Transcript_39137:1041-1640(+)